MRILFDHNVNRRFRKHLLGHVIETTRENSWERLENGSLLRAAADAGFEVVLSIDKKLEHEQNLQTLPLPVVVIDSPSNALPALIPFVSTIMHLLNSPLDRMLYIVRPGGEVIRLTSPRR